MSGTHGPSLCSVPTQSVSRRFIPFLLCASGLLFSACSGIPPAPPAPELELLSAAPLQLPESCGVAGGSIYRAEFTVTADGTVSGIATTGAAECARHAVANWVSTFRYRPPLRDVPAVMDWMPVVAARGG